MTTQKELAITGVLHLGGIKNDQRNWMGKDLVDRMKQIGTFPPHDIDLPKEFFSIRGKDLQMFRTVCLN